MARTRFLSLAVAAAAAALLATGVQRSNSVAFQADADQTGIVQPAPAE
jgi:hypothetical protein